MEMEVERPRKRRAINACTSCRTSKVRCDGQKPCARCVKNSAECRYFDAVKDANVSRIERLEEEVENLKMALEPTGQTNVLAMANISTSPAISASSMMPQHSNTYYSPPRSDAFGPAFPTLPNEFEPLQVPGTSRSSSLVAVEKGIITWEQAEFYFKRRFFLRKRKMHQSLIVPSFSLLTSILKHYLIPIFSPPPSTSISTLLLKSPFLLDTLLTIGCRAEEGSNSPTYHRLNACVRDHLAHILIHTTGDIPTLETVQAIAVKAAYSDDGLVHIALALRFAIQLGLPWKVERLVAMIIGRGDQQTVSEEENRLFKEVRVWFGICNFELFFSLDGGKLPSISLQTSPRRIRLLATHPSRTPTDLRLFSQIELNILRANAYTSISPSSSSSTAPPEPQIRSTVSSTALELSLWLSEWSTLISSSFSCSAAMMSPNKQDMQKEKSMALINLRVQYNWALITLHLKALTNTGIENIALMTDFQRDMVRIAKDAAAAHLHLLLERPLTATSTTSPAAAAAATDSAASPLTVSPAAASSSSHVGISHTVAPPPPYLATFKHTMDYVWAKCAFSILLVLKLSLLLRDPLPVVLSHLTHAYRVLEELEKVTHTPSGRERGGGTRNGSGNENGQSTNIAYLGILRTSIEKCESALREFMQREGVMEVNGGGGGGGSIGGVNGEGGRAEDEFQGYAPSEFVFEWDFPGLNLRCVQLGWQDLFADLENVF